MRCLAFTSLADTVGFTVADTEFDTSDAVAHVRSVRLRCTHPRSLRGTREDTWGIITKTNSFRKHPERWSDALRHADSGVRERLLELLLGLFYFMDTALEV
jgi:hypothetical protein